MNKKIAVLGGGTGLSSLLKGLKNFPVDITAVITVSDDGSSTGKLRNEFNIPAVGAIRNLILVAMLNMTGNLKESISALAKLLDVRHTVLPLSEDFLTLMGETIGGEIIEGEANITSANKKYNRIFYKEEPHVLPDVINAIMDADLVILSMGSLYTSLLPNLVCKEVKEAINKTSAKVMYLCNAMTQPGETDDFGVSDHLKVLTNCLGEGSIDVVISANSEIDKDTLEKYRRKKEKNPVIIDKDKVKDMNIELISDDILSIQDGTIRHDGLKLGSIIFSYMMRK